MSDKLYNNDYEHEDPEYISERFGNLNEEDLIEHLERALDFLDMVVESKGSLHAQDVVEIKRFIKEMKSL